MPLRSARSRSRFTARVGTVPAVGHPTGRGMGGIAVVERFAVHVDGEQYRAFCTIGPDDTCVFQVEPPFDHYWHGDQGFARSAPMTCVCGYSSCGKSIA